MQTYRRWGHELMRPISRAELKPYVETIEQVRTRNTRLDWKALHGRLEQVAEIARSEASPYSTTPGVYTRFKYDREAAAVFVEIADRLDPDLAINSVSALYLMRELTPSRFTADRRTGSRDSTFDHALANIVKGRAGGQQVVYEAATGGRMKVSQEGTHEEDPTAPRGTHQGPLWEPWGCTSRGLKQTGSQTRRHVRRGSRPLWPASLEARQSGQLTAEPDPQPCSFVRLLRVGGLSCRTRYREFGPHAGMPMTRLIAHQQIGTRLQIQREIADLPGF